MANLKKLQTYIWVVPNSAHWPSWKSQVSISIRPCPFPPKCISVHHSSVTLSFNAMWCETLTVSLNQPHNLKKKRLQEFTEN